MAGLSTCETDSKAQPPVGLIDRDYRLQMLSSGTLRWFCMKDGCFHRCDVEESMLRHLASDHGHKNPEHEQTHGRMVSKDPANVGQQKNDDDDDDDDLDSENWERTSQSLRSRWRKLKSSQWCTLCERGVANHAAIYLNVDPPRVPNQPPLARVLAERMPSNFPSNNLAVPWHFMLEETEWPGIRAQLNSILRTDCVRRWCNTVLQKFKCPEFDCNSLSQSDRELCRVSIDILHAIFDPARRELLLPMRQQVLEETIAFFDAFLSRKLWLKERSRQGRDAKIRDRYKSWKKPQLQYMKELFADRFGLTIDEAFAEGKLAEKWVDSSDDEEREVIEQPSDQPRKRSSKRPRAEGVLSDQSQYAAPNPTSTVGGDRPHSCPKSPPVDPYVTTMGNQPSSTCSEDILSPPVIPTEEQACSASDNNLVVYDPEFFIKFVSQFLVDM